MAAAPTFPGLSFAFISSCLNPKFYPSRSLKHSRTRRSPAYTPIRALELDQNTVMSSQIVCRIEVAVYPSNVRIKDQDFGGVTGNISRRRIMGSRSLAVVGCMDTESSMVASTLWERRMDEVVNKFCAAFDRRNHKSSAPDYEIEKRRIDVGCCSLAFYRRLARSRAVACPVVDREEGTTSYFCFVILVPVIDRKETHVVSYDLSVADLGDCDFQICQ
ncbi:hypothetical protein KSP40_PGU016153 [Platanthera guangdongensis]|uniref:Uncharacterized protein n=1 Tax=Platanthera guangdongensis TaxID=2320717 RepID=A0ABR2N0B5_9ASPA